VSERDDLINECAARVKFCGELVCKCPEFSRRDILELKHQKIAPTFYALRQAIIDNTQRNQLTDAAIELLLLKDGDRDHMNHSDLTCEQSMAIVELLRSWRRSGASLGEILHNATS